MASKSKETILEQRRILEKSLQLRLQKLSKDGISEQKTGKDPKVKYYKARIKAINQKMLVVEKYARRTEELAQAKAEKAAAPAVKKEGKSETVAAPTEHKPKKQAAGSGEKEPKEPKKQKAAAADGASKKKPAHAEAAPAEAKTEVKKEAPAPAGEAEPKKRPRKKKEEPKQE